MLRLAVNINIIFADRKARLDIHCQGQLNLNEIARQYVAEESSLRVKHLNLNGAAKSFQHA